jgi:uncharacterized RDD family membrane protein YckC
MQTVRIQTTQNVFIEYETASLGDRVVALLIDWCIFTAYWSTVFYLLNEILKIHDEVYYLIASIPHLFYHLLCEVFLNGQSIGKRIRKIKVAKLDGTQPTFFNYFLRWILRGIDFFPFLYGIGIIAISANGRGQRLGDIAAGTTVINLQRRVSLQETLLPDMEEDYQPEFPQVVNLSDKDVSIIREAMRIHNQDQTLETIRMMDKLAVKIMQLLDITSRKPSYPFLETILRDYVHLTGKS